MPKKKVDMLELKIRFNDIVMRELGLDLEDHDYVVDMETESILQINEKFIKYFDYEYPMVKHNEIELNLIENPRLTETLALPYFSRYCNKLGVEFHTMSQCAVPGTNKGYFSLSYIENGEIKDIKSDSFVNESLRIFNLICKINKTEMLYDFDDYDIEIIRKK
jgi:hypothetical protein